MKKRKTIHIFGNPLLDFDNLTIKLLPKLQELFPDVNFVVFDPNENLNPINKELIIIDTIEGIDKVVLLDNIDKIQTQKLYSLHDFDLGFNLKLLQKIGKLKTVKIFGVPMNGDGEEILEQLMKFIRDCL